jgi:hypothetical protein
MKLEDNVVSVLQRIEEVEELLKARKPSFMKSFLSFL